MALAVPEPRSVFDGAAELVDLLARRPAWQARAACRGMGPDDWFPNRGPGCTEALARARAVCATCPVTKECEDFGGGAAGVWGGQSQRERQIRRRPTPAAEPAPAPAPAPVKRPADVLPATPRTAYRHRQWSPDSLGRSPEGAVLEPDAVTLEQWRASPAGDHAARRRPPADLTAVVEALIAELARSCATRS